MSVLFVKVERVEDLIHREDDYFTQPRQKQKSITNADRIRSMTDEELADWLGVYCNGQTAQEVGKPCVSDMGSCEECWLDWLKQEAVSDG